MCDWPKLKLQLAECRKCHDLGLAEPGAKPLFMKQTPVAVDVLFVAEAPNAPDTFDPKKGYLTIEADTDPSGRFFRELLDEHLQLPEERIAVTNSVLCLPKRNNDRYPVTGKTMRACTDNLRATIEALNPAIVAPLGSVALQATGKVAPHGLTKMSDAVANPLPWFGRILFPLYHTGMLARNGPSGRKAPQQREDWQALKRALQAGATP